MSIPQTLLAADRADALSLSHALQKSDAGIVSRTLLQSPELGVMLFAFAEGQELTLHTNRRRALVQVHEGSGDFFYNDQWQRLAAGTVLHLPPDHPHAVKAGAGPFSLLLTLGSDAAPAPVSP